MPGDSLPDVAEQPAGRLAFEQPGIAVAVVDVVARLPARRIMHVQDQVQAVLPAPLHAGIDPVETVLAGGQAHVVLVGEQLVMERKPDRIGARRGDEGDVLLRDIVVLELLPKRSRFVGPDHLAQQVIDHPRRIGPAEAEHVPLRVEPVPEVGSLDEEGLPVRSDQGGPVDGHEGFGRAGRH